MINKLSKKEINIAISKIQDLEGLKFKYYDGNRSNYIFNIIGDPFLIIFDQDLEKSFQERETLNNLIKWNSEITIKIIHLRNTFIYLSTYLDRYKKSNSSKDLQYFRYFCEVISYFFVSVRDSILQLLNCYLNSPINKEHEVNLKKVKKVLEKNNQEILVFVNDFEDSIEKFRETIRNNFTHKTNPFNQYFLTTLDGEKSMGIDYTETLSNDEFYSELIRIFKSLSEYIENLRPILHQ